MAPWIRLALCTCMLVMPAVLGDDKVAPHGRRSADDWSEAELRRYRGSIATVRCAIPFGPRPDKGDNVVFTPMYGRYAAADRARMRAAYKQRGYTHWAIGPLIAGTYHDQYPDVNDLNHPDAFADQLEELWSDGLVPVVFLLPLDKRCGLNAEGKVDWPGVDRTLSPIYCSSRFQRLAKVVVLAWEPDDGGVVATSDDWLKGVAWMSKTFPNALRYIHMSPGCQSPCAAIESPADAWRAVAPMIHGWLVQSGRFGETDADKGDASRKAFVNDLQQLVNRLHHGADGWPTVSATPGRPLDIVAFEYGSYWNYWHNRPEEEARQWGEAVLKVKGIAGFGDGGPAGR